MDNVVEIIVLTQPPGAWIGLLACVNSDLNNALRPLYAQHVGHWTRVAACDRIMRLVGVARNVALREFSRLFNETRIGWNSGKIVHRQVLTQDWIQECKRLVIDPVGKSMMLLSILWIQNDDCWRIENRMVRLNHYTSEKQIPMLFQRMLYIEHLEWDMYHSDSQEEGGDLI